MYQSQLRDLPSVQLQIECIHLVVRMHARRHGELPMKMLPITLYALQRAMPDCDVASLQQEKITG